MSETNANPSQLTGVWKGDIYLAGDREIAIFSEHPRGEDRYYWAKERTPGGGSARLWSADRDWTTIPEAAGFDKRAVKRRVERYIRETQT